MKSEIEEKLTKIRSAWNSFFLSSEYCRKFIRFDDEVKTNYFGDVLGYFDDTLDVIFIRKTPKTISERFISDGGLLQAIYIHQDFVKEILRIFRMESELKKLLKDPNYILNREIRNELIGHPFRRRNGKLISSTLFGYNEDKDSIEYLRYHKKNNFNFDFRSFKVTEIIKRHSEFINTYLEKIIRKSENIIGKYKKEIENIEHLFNKNDFELIIKLVGIYFENLFIQNYLYDRESILKIFQKKGEHERYAIVINNFQKDLKGFLKDTKKSIREFLEPNIIKDNPPLVIPIKIVSVSKNDSSERFKSNARTDFSYELQKLHEKHHFNFCNELLRRRCKKNKLVLDELINMENNIDNDIEYYSSYYLIERELGKINGESGELTS